MEDAAITIFVHYHHVQHHNSVCEANPNMNYRDSVTKHLECFDGWTDIGLFAYFDSELILDECNECMAPEQPDEEDVIAYYLEVPCRSLCGEEDESSIAVSTIDPPHSETRKLMNFDTISSHQPNETQGKEKEEKQDVAVVVSKDRNVVVTQSHDRSPQELPFYLQGLDHVQ
jgi:hypothetical protein